MQKDVLVEFDMIYTPLTKLAMKTAFDAHNNVQEEWKITDKAGVPYIFHPIHVAYQMETEDEICVALLHDVVEDTDVSLNDLRIKGFPERIINSLKLLTKEKNDSKSIGKDAKRKEYIDYIKNLKASGDNVVIKVKLADLRHNSDRSRIDEHSLNDEDRERFEELFSKYEEAIWILSNEG